MRLVDHKAGLRTIALFEAGKGFLVLLVGLGILSLMHRNLQENAEELVRHFHLDPASHYPRVFLEAAKELTDARLLLLSGAALLYVSFRWAEAYGLWYQRGWAQWLGLVSSALYIPVETYELVQGISWPKAAVLLSNLAIVGYLSYAMISARRTAGPTENS